MNNTTPTNAYLSDEEASKEIEALKREIDEDDKNADDQDEP